MAPLCTRVVPQQNNESEVEGAPNSESDAESQTSSEESFYPSADSAVNFSQQFYANEASLVQLLQRTTGKEDLNDISELKLRAVSEEISLSRISALLPQLTTLNLDGSSLTSLRELGCSLNKLKVLRVCYCGINSLDGILGMTSLKELYASYNHIQNIGLCASLPQLEVLVLRRNNLSSFQNVEFLCTCSNLRKLTLAENEMCGEPNYRSRIIALFPQLRVLDDIPCGPGGGRCGNSSASDSETTSESSLSEFEATPPQSLTLSTFQSNSSQAPPQLTTVSDADKQRTHVSSLTSGSILCGNIAKSLCSKKRAMKDCGSWALAPVNKTAFTNEKIDAMQASRHWRLESAKLRFENL